MNLQFNPSGLALLVLVNELNRRQYFFDVGPDLTDRNSMGLAENTVRKLGIAISIILTSNGTHP